MAIGVIGYVSPVSLVWLIGVNSPAAHFVGILPERITLDISLLETASYVIIVNLLYRWGVYTRLTSRSLV